MGVVPLSNFTGSNTLLNYSFLSLSLLCWDTGEAAEEDMAATLSLWSSGVSFSKILLEAGVQEVLNCDLMKGMFTINSGLMI